MRHSRQGCRSLAESPQRARKKLRQRRKKKSKQQWQRPRCWKKHWERRRSPSQGTKCQLRRGEQ